MSPEDPIAVYLKELKAHLRARGPRRRRILAEVEAHLCQRRMDLQRAGVAESDAAAQEAVARFGDPRRMAAQFNEVRRRPRILERRLTALWVSWIAAMAMGTATVWAAVDSPGRSLAAHHATIPGAQSPLCAPKPLHLSNLLGQRGRAPMLQAAQQKSRGEDPRCP
jgi:hypothetical protein